MYALGHAQYLNGYMFCIADRSRFWFKCYVFFSYRRWFGTLSHRNAKVSFNQRCWTKINHIRKIYHVIWAPNQNTQPKYHRITEWIKKNNTHTSQRQSIWMCVSSPSFDSCACNVFQLKLIAFPWTWTHTIKVVIKWLEKFWN